MCGFVHIILRNPSNAMRNNMLVYASGLLQNALDLGWHLAKGSYKVPMTEMESSSLDWGDLEGVQSLRRQYAQGNVNRPTGNSSRFNSPQLKQVVCPQYQTGMCSHVNDHRSDRQYFRNICAFCYTSISKPFPYREQDCLRKKGRLPTGAGAGASGAWVR